MEARPGVTHEVVEVFTDPLLGTSESASRQAKQSDLHAHTQTFLSSSHFLGFPWILFPSLPLTGETAAPSPAVSLSFCPR